MVQIDSAQALLNSRRSIFSGIEIMDADWANLPKHLLDSVVERLVLPSDYFQFSFVCKSWCSVAKDNKSRRSKMTTPMLLISANKKHAWHLYRIIDNKILDLQISVPNKRYCGSSKGWLINVEKNFVVTLINPFFRVKGRRKKENSIIRLPPLTPPLEPILKRHWSRRFEYYAVKATMTADPILNASDCVVVIIYEDICQMAFIRLSKDSTWTYIDESVDKRWRLVEEVTYFQDRFYAVDHWNRLISFDIAPQSNSDVKLVAQGIEGKLFDKKYIVNSIENELLMVQRYYILTVNSTVTVGFKVLKFKFDECDWIEKKTLGDVALFLGDNTSISVSTSNFPGCQANNIYFCHDRNYNDYRRRYCDSGVYDVKSQTITYFDMPLLKMTNRPAIWIVPTFQL
ncbi:hypothetical protein M0R45_011618 [Rubus argutus]|uniref:F-box domain-containing protein n=1 Tax=Rubus argutus TaxID=59490 RepID=A0AAW1YAH3_RUBAR